MVYGLGEKDLPENVSPERKARVKQLEAYLTFLISCSPITLASCCM
jgi:hypothetical protein